MSRDHRAVVTHRELLVVADVLALGLRVREQGKEAIYAARRREDVRLGLCFGQDLLGRRIGNHLDVCKVSEGFPSGDAQVTGKMPMRPRSSPRHHSWYALSMIRTTSPRRNGSSPGWSGSGSKSYSARARVGCVGAGAAYGCGAGGWETGGDG